jgi:hypothetical protein
VAADSSNGSEYACRVPELWLPGLAGPHEDFVQRLHRHIERFAREREIERASVEVELRDGSRFRLDRVLPEPGFGFITIVPHEQQRTREEDVPAEVIVPIALIERIEIHEAEEQGGRFGFSLPESGS